MQLTDKQIVYSPPKLLIEIRFSFLTRSKWQHDFLYPPSGLLSASLFQQSADLKQYLGTHQHAINLLVVWTIAIFWTLYFWTSASYYNLILVDCVPPVYCIGPHCLKIPQNTDYSCISHSHMFTENKFLEIHNTRQKRYMEVKTTNFAQFFLLTNITTRPLSVCRAASICNRDMVCVIYVQFRLCN